MRTKALEKLNRILSGVLNRSENDQTFDNNPQTCFLERFETNNITNQDSHENETDENLYAQEDEFAFIHEIIPLLKPTFLDIGAEKGTFSRLCLENGMTGIAFEPLPDHIPALSQICKSPDFVVYPWAIDSIDRDATLHIALDENGSTLDYFHSLQKINGDERVHHLKEIKVQCRQLQSLRNENLIPVEIGILKTDTEGNDLRVLKGLEDIRPQIIICEFFTEGIYQGWEDSHPMKLINYLSNLGYEHYIAFVRYDDKKYTKFDSIDFSPKEWGNLLFFHKSVYSKIQKNKNLSQNNLKEDTINSTLLGEFLSELLVKKDNNGLILDVGAYRGDFSKELLKNRALKKAVLFEANPENVKLLHDNLSDKSEFEIVNLAISNKKGRTKFNFNNDLATGSLLDYASNFQKISSIEVNTSTLDRWLEDNFTIEPIHILKVDTQGHDFEVIKGAEKLLQNQQPILVIELIWVELYKNQARPDEIFSYLHTLGYSLAGFFNEHKCKEGYIAFSDAVFVANSWIKNFTEEFHVQIADSALVEENRLLYNVCNDRLELINLLHNEAAKLQVMLREQTKAEKSN
jgi:FkbM family methyltransferase